MKLFSIILVIHLHLALFTGACFGASITAEVDRLRGLIDEPFWLTVTVEGSLEGDLKIPQGSEFELSRTGESTNISIVNGAVTKQRQYTFQLLPLKAGRITVPSITAIVDGKQYSSLPLSIEVSSAGPKSGNSGDGNDNRLVFAERDIPKKVLYVGEAMISTVRLLTRARLTGATPSRDAAPSWRLIPVEGQKNIEVIRDGIKWNAIEMREGLIPLKSGKTTVPSFGINATWIQPVEKSRRGPPSSVFDMFQQGMFNMGQEVTRTVRSLPLDVDVRPLPAPIPKEFYDIVGAFEVSSSISKKSLRVGDTATLTIEVRGQGALDRMKDIKLVLPGSKIYADRPELKESIEAGAGLVSTRTMKFAVVPEQSGIQDLGVIRMKSFNPFTEQYDELNVQLGVIHVEPNQSMQTPIGTKQDAKSGESSSSIGNVPSQSNPAPTEIPLKKLDMKASSVTAWWLAPWALALEILVIIILTSWVLVKKSIGKTKADKDMAAPLKSNLWRGFDLKPSDPQSIVSFFKLVSCQHALPGQDPRSLTGNDILANASLKDMPPNLREALKRVLLERDRAVYSEMKSVSLQDELASDIAQLIEFYKNHPQS